MSFTNNMVCSIAVYRLHQIKLHTTQHNTTTLTAPPFSSDQPLFLLYSSRQDARQSCVYLPPDKIVGVSTQFLLDGVDPFIDSHIFPQCKITLSAVWGTNRGMVANPAYWLRSPPRVNRHRANSPQGNPSSGCRLFRYSNRRLPSRNTITVHIICASFLPRCIQRTSKHAVFHTKYENY